MKPFAFALKPFPVSLDQMPFAHLLFVDDGSKDDTYFRIERFSRKHSNRVSLYGFVENGGKGEAVRFGLLQALKANPTYIGYWDADLATPLTEVREFLSLFRARPEVEFILGARVRLLGRAIHRHVGRHYLGRIFATLIASSLGIPVYDTQCGAKIFRRTPNLDEVLGKPFCTRWLFDAELLRRYRSIYNNQSMSQFTRRVVELPLNNWSDVKGGAIRFAEIHRIGIDLVRFVFCC